MRCKICNSRTEIWYKKLYDDRHGYLGYFDIKRCLNCGFAQTDPQLPAEKIEGLYSKYYPRQKIDLKKIKRKNHQIDNRFEVWLKGVTHGCEYWVDKETKVLDVGSGLGFSLLRLESIGCKAFGLDPDQNAKKVARKFGLKFHHGFIEDNPFPKEKFDFVIASQVLEHTNSPKEFLVFCKSRLKKGGKVILSFPNTDSLGRKLFGKNWLHWHIPYHLNHFNRKSFLFLAKKVGLEIETIKTITPNLWTNLQIKRLMHKPEMGERDVSWDSGKKPKGKTKKYARPVKALFNFLEKYNLLNRAIDFLGYGESYLVILSVEK